MNFDGDIPYWSSTENQHYAGQKELIKSIEENERNVFGRRVFAGLHQLSSRPMLSTVLRTCGIRSPRWYALFGTKRRSLPVEPDLVTRLAVLLHDDPVELYSQMLDLLFPACEGMVLHRSWEQLSRPTSEEMKSFLKVRDARAAEMYQRLKESKNQFGLMAFERLASLYAHKSRRRYSMRGLAQAANMHVARIHDFLEEKDPLRTWEIGSLLRMALFLEVDPLELLAECLDVRDGELTAPLLGSFFVEDYHWNEINDVYPHFALLWKELLSDLFSTSDTRDSMRFVQHFMAWRFLSWEKIETVKQSLQIFQGKTMDTVPWNDVEEIPLNPEQVARLTACWTLLWETILDIQEPFREGKIDRFLMFWQVYRNADDVERLLLDSQMRLSDEATRLLPEIDERERSKLFPELKKRHTKKGQE
jgi:hypothetical protein